MICFRRFFVVVDDLNNFLFNKKNTIL